MRKTLAVFAVAAAAVGCGKNGGPTTAATFSVTSYDYALDLSTRAMTETLTVVPSSAGNCFTFDYQPPSVDRVTFDGAKARVSLTANGKMIACGRAFTPGVPVTVVATLTVPKTHLGASQVGFTVSYDLAGQPFTYLLSWVNECGRFGPCDATPSRFASYRFRVTHPAGTTVLCSGLVATSPTETTCDFPWSGGPTYSTIGVLASADWTKSDLGVFGAATHATLYDEASSGIAAAFPTAQAAAYFGWMEQTFGPYSYGAELRFAIAPTYWAGFEHPGDISLVDNLATGPSYYADPVEHTTLHEMTHQWAGDETTLAGTYDFAWKESMAEYLPFTWEDEHISTTVSAQTAAGWKLMAANAHWYPSPIDDPPPTLYQYYGDAYGPGPMVLFRQIEAMYGRAAVIDALKLVLGRQGAISIADLQGALETTTGANLTPYFDAWVYGTGVPAWPKAAITITPTGVGTNVTVSAAMTTADGVARGCAFHVRLADAGATQSFDVPLSTGPDGTAQATWSGDPGFVVASHVVDPLSECLVTEGTAFAPAADEPPRLFVNPWVARPDLVYEP